jgi:hypothetical protein
VRIARKERFVIDASVAVKLPMIWRLVQEWKMPAEVLVRPYALSTQRTTRAERAAGKTRTAP